MVRSKHFGLLVVFVNRVCDFNGIEFTETGVCKLYLQLQFLGFKLLGYDNRIKQAMISLHRMAVKGLNREFCFFLFFSFRSYLMTPFWRFILIYSHFM